MSQVTLDTEDFNLEQLVNFLNLLKAEESRDNDYDRLYDLAEDLRSIRSHVTRILSDVEYQVEALEDEEGDEEE